MVGDFNEVSAAILFTTKFDVVTTVSGLIGDGEVWN